MANLNLSQFTEKTLVADADWVFVWDTAGAISKKVSRNSLLNSGTLATSAPVTISQTWNAGSNPMTALRMDVSDTASGSTSNLIDIRYTTPAGVVTTPFALSKSGVLSLYRAQEGGGIDLATYGFLSAFNWQMRNSNGYIGLGATATEADTRLYRDTDNTLALRNSTAAQTFNVYGTYTSITDYKRLSLSCSNTTGNATIGVPFNSVLAVTGGSATATVATVTFAAQAAAFPIGSSVTVAGVTPAGYNATAVVTASTTTSVSYASTVNAAYVSGGTATVSGSANWILQSGGHLLAGTDNTYDIGAGGANRPRNIYVGTSLVAGSTIDAPYIRAGSAGGLQMQGRFFMSSTADGNICLTNNAITDFGRLQFGGTTPSFPALKRTGAALEAKLADDSAYASFNAGIVGAVGYFSNASVVWRTGTGDPNGVYTAAVGSIFSRTDGGAGTSFYVKESGTGNTGWVAK